LTNPKCGNIIKTPINEYENRIMVKAKGAGGINND